MTWLFDDQPQMVDAMGPPGVSGYAGQKADLEALGRAFAAIDRDALIEKVARAKADRDVGSMRRWTFYADAVEKDLIAANIIPERS